MTDPASYPVRLADEIARLIGQLDLHLAEAPPHQAAQILAKVYGSEDGVLCRLASLMATGSQVAKRHSETAGFPPEVWLVLGGTASQLSELSLKLDLYADRLGRLADRGAPTQVPSVSKPASGDGQRR